jgi:hypothetical protein
MKLYNPRGVNSTRPQQTEQSSSKTFPVFNWLQGFLIGSILAPISLFLGVMTLAALVLIAFGKVDYWGTTGKFLVGIVVPLIIILSLVSKPIGNMIFVIWSFLLYCIVIVIPLIAVVYFMGIKPIFEYLGS